MPAGFQLNVITQARILMSGEVHSVTAPGSEGYLGIWANHAPLATALQPGKLTIKDSRGSEAVYAVTGGFLEVSRNVVTLLADAMEPPAEIDVERAEAAAERARKRLAERGPDIDLTRAEAALARALVRLKVAREAVRRAG
jgi:F-type H+-transporting ATPase subunit epsilon